MAIVTNDDGVDAVGIAALLGGFRDLVEAHVVAPLSPCSGCGHAVTTHRPIRVEQRSARSYAVDGTPGDCVRIALASIAPRAEWVLSGINAGGNLGCDIFHSGTVAAAREAALRARRAIAFSQYLIKGRPVAWERAGRWAKRVFAELQQRETPPRAFWNVNFPHLEATDAEPEIVECSLDLSPLPNLFRTDAEFWTYSGQYRDRARSAGGDIDVCFGGAISVTLVSVGH